jgi:hypothetical protein
MVQNDEVILADPNPEIQSPLLISLPCQKISNPRRPVSCQALTRTP